VIQHPDEGGYDGRIERPVLGDDELSQYIEGSLSRPAPIS